MGITTRVCKFKDNCTYAHGDHEIRTQMDNAKAIAGQQLPCSQQFDPLKQPSIAKIIRKQQLVTLVDKLEEFHAGDFSKLESVNNAKISLEADNLDQASIVLQVCVLSEIRNSCLISM